MVAVFCQEENAQVGVEADIVIVLLCAGNDDPGRAKPGAVQMDFL